MLVSNNMETVKKLKRIFDDFRLAARMYAQVNILDNVLPYEMKMTCINVLLPSYVIVNNS